MMAPLADTYNYTFSTKITLQISATPQLLLFSHMLFAAGATYLLTHILLRNEHQNNKTDT